MMIKENILLVTVKDWKLTQINCKDNDEEFEPVIIVMYMPNKEPTKAY